MFADLVFLWSGFRAIWCFIDAQIISELSQTTIQVSSHQIRVASSGQGSYGLLASHTLATDIVSCSVSKVSTVSDRDEVPTVGGSTLPECCEDSPSCRADRRFGELVESTDHLVLQHTRARIIQHREEVSQISWCSCSGWGICKAVWQVCHKVQHQPDTQIEVKVLFQRSVFNGCQLSKNFQLRHRSQLSGSLLVSLCNRSPQRSISKRIIRLLTFIFEYTTSITK